MNGLYILLFFLYLIWLTADPILIWHIGVPNRNFDFRRLNGNELWSTLLGITAISAQFCFTTVRQGETARPGGLHVRLCHIFLVYLCNYS